MSNRRWPLAATVGATLCLLFPLSGAMGEETVAPLATDVPRLLAQVRAGIPRDHLAIKGVLNVVRRKGIVERSFGVDADLRLGQVPSTARYTIRDAFGARLEELELVENEGLAPIPTYRKGDPPQPAEAPPLHTGIQGSDLSWTDLSFSYLWWTNGVVLGRDVVRGQSCQIVQLWPPNAPGTDAGAYAWMRLWIAENVCAVIRAEAYSRDGNLIRRMDVRSVRKIGDRWMVKDLEIEGTNSQHRTRIEIEDMTEPDRPARPAAPDRAEEAGR